MASVKVYIKNSYVSKNGEMPVYASIYIDREKVEIPCKVSVLAAAWDTKCAKVTTKMKNHADLNLLINNTRKRITDILVEYRLRNKRLNKELFIREFNNPKEFKSFYDFVAWYQKLRFREIEPATIASHESLIKKLKVYKELLLFEEIDGNFIREFQIYLKKTLKNKDTTIAKNITTLKIYVREAVKRKLIDINPFECVKIQRTQRPAVDFLTEAELDKLVHLYKKEWLPDQQQKVLGFFLFMCFTSLHISDARFVKMEDITNDYLTFPNSIGAAQPV